MAHHLYQAPQAVPLFLPPPEVDSTTRLFYDTR